MITRYDLSRFAVSQLLRMLRKILPLPKLEDEHERLMAEVMTVQQEHQIRQQDIEQHLQQLRRDR